MKIVQTEDASHSLFSEQYKEHYHSLFGAIAESQHIFIDAGLKQIKKDNICIFEMGLGTGLNALLTRKYADDYNKKIIYTSIEKHLLPEAIYSRLNYAKELAVPNSYFTEIHTAPLGKEIVLSEKFVLEKIEGDIREFSHQKKYDLVYYDAFSPDTQANLWTKDIFQSLFNCMNSNALFLTYSVKGTVKRALKEVGFMIEKIPGPKGKREILRAYKK